MKRKRILHTKNHFPASLIYFPFCQSVQGKRRLFRVSLFCDAVLIGILGDFAKFFGDETTLSSAAVSEKIT